MLDSLNQLRHLWLDWIRESHHSSEHIHVVGVGHKV